MTHTISLSGHLDTASAAATDERIAREIALLPETPTALVFDCSQLDYISSTGLRIVLKYKKLYPQLEVINVSTEVYNVFEITGFSRIITIRKALRKIDLNTCTRLAHGANGEVYRINDEEIVKLSLLSQGEADLIEEMNCAREAFVMGVPTMISFDTVEVNDGRHGIVLEALNSTTLAQQLGRHPEMLDSYVEPYVNLFHTTNAIESAPGQFRSAKQFLLQRLYSPTRFLDDETTDVISSLIEAIPDANNIIHGDGHPNNALLSGGDDERQLMLIDMGDLSAGHPIFEIMGWAFVMWAPEYSHARNIAKRFWGMEEETIAELYRKMMASYLGITDEVLLQRALDASALVGTLRLISIDQFRAVQGETREKSKKMAATIVARRQDMLDAIQLLSELIAARR